MAKSDVAINVTREGTDYLLTIEDSRESVTFRVVELQDIVEFGRNIMAAAFDYGYGKERKARYVKTS